MPGAFFTLNTHWEAWFPFPSGIREGGPGLCLPVPWRRVRCRRRQPRRKGGRGRARITRKQLAIVFAGAHSVLLGGNAMSLLEFHCLNEKDLSGRPSSLRQSGTLMEPGSRERCECISKGDAACATFFLCWLKLLLHTFGACARAWCYGVQVRSRFFGNNSIQCFQFFAPCIFGKTLFWMWWRRNGTSVGSVRRQESRLFGFLGKQRPLHEALRNTILF